MLDAYIDRSGVVHNNYRESRQLDRYLYVLCRRGELFVTIHTTEQRVGANTLIALLPNTPFKVVSQEAGTELYVVSFSDTTLSPSRLFAESLEQIPRLIERPIVELAPTTSEIMCDYIELLTRIKSHLPIEQSSHFANSTFMQFSTLLGGESQMLLGSCSRAPQSKTMVSRLLALITSHYKEERSATFYSRQLRVTPQHLCSVVKQATNKTITEVVAMFVIDDARNKLVATDLSISEIASALNFDDTSTFSRYFKRHTKLSPRNYRGRHLEKSSRANHTLAIGETTLSTTIVI